jgi:hypothetical protein
MFAGVTWRAASSHSRCSPGPDWNLQSKRSPHPLPYLTSRRSNPTSQSKPVFVAGPEVCGASCIASANSKAGLRMFHLAPSAARPAQTRAPAQDVIEYTTAHR